MDTIAIGWKGAISTSVIEKAINQVGLGNVDVFKDGEVKAGLEECEETLMLDGILCLVDSDGDSTSNKVTMRISEEIDRGLEPCISRIGSLIRSKMSEGQVWFFFAHDWPRGINVTYYEGLPSDLASYLKLNGGAFRLLYSFKRKCTNLDLDTPLVWKLK